MIMDNDDVTLEVGGDEGAAAPPTVKGVQLHDNASVQTEQIFFLTFQNFDFLQFNSCSHIYVLPL